jgi:multiple sugar transport system permease protein
MRSTGMRKKADVGFIALFVILSIACLIAILPIAAALLYSIRPTGEYAMLPTTWINRASLEHYKTVLVERGFRLYALNSLTTTLSSIVISLVIGIPAAYGFSRFIFRGKNFSFSFVLSTWMLPPIVPIIPLFLIIRRLGLYDKLITLSILYGAVNLALVIWILVEFFRQIPIEVEEAAMLDGCSGLGILLRVALPMITPGLVATTILCFIFSWNEFIFAYAFTGPYARTIPVGTLEFVTPHGIQWGAMFATLSIMMIPPIIFVVLTRKHLIRGLIALGGHH